MSFEIKDILTIVGLALAGLVAFFNLRGRVGIIEARQKDDRDQTERTLSRIDTKLDRIEGKLDNKADKS